MTKRMAAAVLGLWLMLAPVIAQAQSLAQMAGQMIMTGFQGDEVDDTWPQRLTGMIARGEVGGVMYLGYNVRSLDDVARINAAWRAASPDLVPFIALDQEGGRIERLTESVGFTEVPGAEWMGVNRDPSEAQLIYADLARRLARLGFNVNFGPVVDLNLNPNNPIIARYGRAYGTDAGLVAAYGGAFVRAHRDAGMATSLKHFPGHGSSRADSHAGFVDISGTWEPLELAPYQALIRAGEADMVMAGHLYHSEVADSAELPASLSAKAINGLLRRDLGFAGVVITDDLEMGAIRGKYSLSETVIRSVRAGNDILLFSNSAKPSLDLPGEIRAILLAEAERDPAFADMIRASYARIVALKRRLQ